MALIQGRPVHRRRHVETGGVTTTHWSGHDSGRNPRALVNFGDPCRSLFKKWVLGSSPDSIPPHFITVLQSVVPSTRLLQSVVPSTRPLQSVLGRSCTLVVNFGDLITKIYQNRCELYDCPDRSCQLVHYRAPSLRRHVDGTTRPKSPVQSTVRQVPGLNTHRIL